MSAAGRFSVADAAQLRRTLQALNDKLTPDVDTATLEEACRPRPVDENVYVDGSEEFFLLVKSIPRADLVPAIYIEAYTAVQRGRFPVNHRRVSDFTKGGDLTFSEIRPLLPQIDHVCRLNLHAAFCTLEDQVRPFPFLRLPAELALHVYAHLLPRERHIALLHQPLRDHKPPRVRLDIMRTNRQLYREVAQYFYEHRTLFMVVARDAERHMRSNEYASRYAETLAAVGAATRRLFTHLEVDIAHFSEHTFTPRRCQSMLYARPMDHVMTLLPNLKIVTIVLGVTPARPAKAVALVTAQRNETLRWFLDSVPQDVEIRWEQASVPTTEMGRQELQTMINTRGTLIDRKSVTMQLALQRDKPS
ncbi:hypothetical protein ACEQ8H_003350 [Pleosporales sp. CAS-2024a]